MGSDRPTAAQFAPQVVTSGGESKILRWELTKTLAAEGRIHAAVEPAGVRRTQLPSTCRPQDRSPHQWTGHDRRPRRRDQPRRLPTDQQRRLFPRTPQRSPPGRRHARRLPPLRRTVPSSNPRGQRRKATKSSQGTREVKPLNWTSMDNTGHPAAFPISTETFRAVTTPRLHLDKRGSLPVRTRRLPPRLSSQVDGVKPVFTARR